MRDLKVKILIVLSLIVFIVAAIMTAYNIADDYYENERTIASARQNVQFAYNETLREVTYFYTARANSNINSPDVIDAIRAGDHDKIYRLILPRWRVLQKENPSLSVMQFHNADGTSLLRMHQPKVYGDPIAMLRPMVAEIHKHHRVVSGFEEGRQGLAFRILVPVIDQGSYLGAVEFGVGAPYITEKIYRYTSHESFFMVQQRFLGKLSHVDQYVPIHNYIAMGVPTNLQTLLKKYQDEHQKLENAIVKVENQSFFISVISVKNFQNESIGAVMFVRPAHDFGSHILTMVLISLVIALLLITVVVFVINRVYDAVSAKLHFQELYSQVILDAIPSPVIVTDGNHLIAANQALLSYFHYSSLEAFKDEHNCICEYFEEGEGEGYLMPIQKDQRWTEYIVQHPDIDHKVRITMDGRTTIFDVKLSNLHFNDETRYVVIFTDISAMQSLSMNDSLTGIANRLHFTMVYQHAVDVAHREHKPLGIIFVDIDHFKAINDTYGHLAGDQVLKQISALVKQKIRKSDVFARWGGEEFIILLPGTPLKESVQIAEILREAINAKHFENVSKITCSFGVGELEEYELSDALLHRADECLYAAKIGGRNRVVHQCR